MYDDINYGTLYISSMGDVIGFIFCKCVTCCWMGYHCYCTIYCCLICTGLIVVCAVMGLTDLLLVVIGLTCFIALWIIMSCCVLACSYKSEEDTYIFQDPLWCCKCISRIPDIDCDCSGCKECCKECCKACCAGCSGTSGGEALITGVCALCCIAVVLVIAFSV